MQAALANVAEHAAASLVRLACTTDDHAWRISVEDDGRGFDPARADGDGHYGLRFMRERAAEIGATLEIDSAPGHGTRVFVWVPQEGHAPGAPPEPEAEIEA